MSYDVSVSVPGWEDELWSQNYTSNCSHLWVDALQLPEKPWIRDGEQVIGYRSDPETGEVLRERCMNRGLRLLDEVPCSEAAGILHDAVTRARAWPPEKLRSYDAPNGWGDGESALQLLEQLAKAARAFPNGTIHVHS